MVSILSFSLFATSQLLLVDLEEQADSADTFRAELLADRALAIALHPSTAAGDPVLEKEMDEYQYYAATISSEGSRLPLNDLLSDPLHHPVLENLLVLWGIRRDEAADIIAKLADWIDPDDLLSPGGAEQRHYLGLERPHHPLNRPFRSLEEVTLVDGFAFIAAANPDWRDSFTLRSSGKLDLNEADADLISVVCECDRETARLFIETRAGVDSNPFTEDDVRFESIDTALALLSVPADRLETVIGRVSVEDPVVRISAQGRFDQITVEKTLSVQYLDGRARILQSSSRRLE